MIVLPTLNLNQFDLFSLTFQDACLNVLFTLLNILQDLSEKTEQVLFQGLFTPYRARKTADESLCVKYFPLENSS